MTAPEPLLCVVCSTPDRPRTAVEGLRVCGRDRDALAGWLEDIGRWWPSLSVLPTTGDGGRRSPGFRSTSPARDDVLALTDSRTTWGEEGDLWHPPEVLRGWAGLVAEEMSHNYLPDGVADSVKYLRDHLTWVCRQDWVVDMTAEIRDIRHQVERLSPEASKRVRIGHCPGPQDSTDGCGTMLVANPAAEAISCRSCGAHWLRQHWPLLGRAMREAG